MAFWSVAQTQPFSENKAQRFLASQSFESYCPKIQVTQHVRNLKRTRELALFARYLFVRIENAWHAINSSPGISCLLLNGAQKPIVVGESVIAELKSREDRNGFVVLPKKEKFKLGQNVKIVSGQFAGQLAVYDGMTSRERERVLLQLLGQYVSVELNSDSRIESVSLH
jgi:transcriptional antiterminator RfaH